LIRKIPTLRQIRTEYDEISGVFEYGPLAPGYAITIGNALRRVLLSSIPGCGIYAVRIDGVLHELTCIPGMREDVLCFIQNLKLISFKLEPEAELLDIIRLTLNIKGPKNVTADMIECPNKLIRIKGSQYLCYLNEGASLKCEIFVKQGEGYLESKLGRMNPQPGLIFIDNTLNAVRRVTIEVEENVQYREFNDYEILRLKVDTDGSIDPNQAIEKAVTILTSQFSRIVSNSPTKAIPNEQVNDELLVKPLEQLGLPVGTVAALKERGIETVGQLVAKTRESLYEIPRVGARKIDDIENALQSIGLALKSADKKEKVRTKK